MKGKPVLFMTAFRPFPQSRFATERQIGRVAKRDTWPTLPIMSHEEQSSQAGGVDPERPLEQFVSKIALEPGAWALFMDIDGTLIDLAERPNAVAVPPDLPEHLHLVSEFFGGAMALVTGRALVYADKLFSPHRFPIAGLHGTERRRPDGGVDRIEVTADFDLIKADLTHEALSWPGVLIEDKGAAIAAHYRQAPERREELEAVMARYLKQAGPDFTLQNGKMVVEIRPSHANKGSALKAFLDEPPFTSRLPIAIGDDVTDEAMFREANALGGLSIRIGEPGSDTAAQYHLPSAAALRRLLAELAECGRRARPETKGKSL